MGSLIIHKLCLFYLIYFAYLSQIKPARRLSNEIEVAKPLYRTRSLTLTWIIEDTEGINSRLVKKKEISPLEVIDTIPEFYWGDADEPKAEDILAYIDDRKLKIKRIYYQALEPLLSLILANNI